MERSDHLAELKRLQKVAIKSGDEAQARAFEVCIRRALRRDAGARNHEDRAIDFSEQ